MPEGRRLFPSLTAEENLLVGAHPPSGPWTVARVLEVLPLIEPLLRGRPTCCPAASARRWPSGGR